MKKIQKEMAIMGLYICTSNDMPKADLPDAWSITPHRLSLMFSPFNLFSSRADTAPVESICSHYKQILNATGIEYGIIIVRQNQWFEASDSETDTAK